MNNLPKHLLELIRKWEDYQIENNEQNRKALIELEKEGFVKKVSGDQSYELTRKGKNLNKKLNPKKAF
jgi:predicted transcriptional regulator